MTNLRKKIHQNGREILHNMPGRGYMIGESDE